jgi:rubrerythrin
MKPEQLKELWELRFLKIWEGEREALIFYKDLLHENKELLVGTKTKRILEQIKRDEAKHARIAHELLNLVKQKKITE